MDRPALIYPHLEAEFAAAHLDLLAGILDGRIIPEPDQGPGAEFFYYIYDPEQLTSDEHEQAVARFDREVLNLEDEGLIVFEDGSRVPVATDAGRAWFDRMQADLEAMMAIDQDRVYLVARPDGGEGYLHAYDPVDDDEFDGQNLDLTALRRAGLIDWEGDMIPFITPLGGEFLDAYRPELFEQVAA